MAHVPASPGRKPQPFENGPGLDVHNAAIMDFDSLTRDQVGAVVGQGISVRDKSKGL